MMSKFSLGLLSQDEIQTIHDSSISLLENCGMVVPNRDVLETLRHHAEVDSKKMICKFPRTLVEESIKKCPSRIVLGARDPSNTMTVTKGNEPRFLPLIGAKYVNDLETRERRLAQLQDQADFNRVINALEYIHAGGEVVHPSDAPTELAQYYSWNIAFKNTSKHLFLYQPDAHGVEVAVRMGTALSGNPRRFADSPLMSFCTCLPEVLGFEAQALRGMVETFRHRIPLLIEAGPAAGATGPATMAGTLVLSNAETLGAITLAQVLNPGTPVIYLGYARHFDMKAEQVSFASPEFILMRICQGQMTSYYDIPSDASGLATDSKVLDVQAGFDKSIALISVLSGNELITSDAMDQADIVDLAELVVNDELAAAYSRVWKGFEINEDTLALDEIVRVGPGLGHNFIGTRHTMTHFRNESWLGYRITERRKWDVWNKQGAKTSERKAVERVKEILKNHHPDPISSIAQKELDTILQDEILTGAEQKSI